MASRRVVLLCMGAVLASCCVLSCRKGPESGDARVVPSPTAQSTVNADIVLATHDSGAITSGDVLFRFGGADAFARTAGLVAEASRVEWLKEQIVGVHRFRMMARKAAEEGVVSSTEAQSQMDRLRRDIALRLARHEIEARLPSITEAELREDYDRNVDRYKSIGRLRFQFIFIRTDNLNTDAERESARNRAEQALKELQNGEAVDTARFSAVAEKYSDSTGAKGQEIEENLGRLNQKLEEALLSLKDGEVSEVIPITWGYQILRLIKSTPSSQRPFEEVKEDIRTAIQSRNRTQAEEAYYREIRNNPEISEGVRVNFDIAGDRNAPATAAVFSIGGEVFTVGDYRRLYESIPPAARRDLDSDKGRNSYLEGVVFKPRLLAYAMARRGVLDDPEVQNELELLRQNDLVEAWIQMRRREYVDRTVVGEDEIREYYNANQDRFMAPAMFRVNQARVRASTAGAEGSAERGRAMEEARTKARVILEEIRQGVALAEAVRANFAEDPLVSYWESPLGPMSDYEPELQRELAKVAAVGILKQVVPENGSFLLADVKEFTPATNLPLIEVAQNIRRQLLDEGWDREMSRLVDGLLGPMVLHFDENGMELFLAALDLK